MKLLQQSGRLYICKLCALQQTKVYSCRPETVAVTDNDIAMPVAPRPKLPIKSANGARGKEQSVPWIVPPPPPPLPD